MKLERDDRARLESLLLPAVHHAEGALRDRFRPWIVEALRAGETNYPPSDGTLVLRDAIRSLYRRELGFTPDLASVIVTAGSRPGIHTTYRGLLEPGYKRAEATPWGNNDQSVTVVDAPATRLTVQRAPSGPPHP